MGLVSCPVPSEHVDEGLQRLLRELDTHLYPQSLE